MSLVPHRGEVFPASDGRYVWLFIDSVNKANVKMKDGAITKKYCSVCMEWRDISEFRGAINTRDTRRMRPLRDEFKTQGKTLLLGLAYMCNGCRSEREAEWYRRKRARAGRGPRRTLEEFITHDEHGVEMIECRVCHGHFYRVDFSKPYVIKQTGRTKQVRVCKRCAGFRISKYRALRCARTLYREGSPVFDALKGASGRDRLQEVCELWDIHPNRKFQTADEGELRRKLSRLRIKEKWFARSKGNKKKVPQDPQGRHGHSDVPMRDLRPI